MRKLLYSATMLISFCAFVGCGEPDDATLKPKQNLKSALAAYYDNRLDTFLMCVDFGADLDNSQRQVVMASYRTHLKYTNKHFNGVRAIEPKSVQFDGDTIAYVLYDIVYRNQVRVTSSQKMIKVGDTWKLRARN